MAKDFIRYDLHVQDALRGVVRQVLSDVVRDGLPGEHYFYITFRTQHPGVRLSSRMRAEYPDEMTIVLQHQFWDLAVTDQAFEVGLSFKGIPEKLVVPFEALTGFFDRSVDFGLRFESDVDIDEEDETDDGFDGEDTLPSGQVTQGAFPRRIFEVKGDEGEMAPSPAIVDEPADHSHVTTADDSGEAAKAASDADAQASQDDNPDDDSDGRVVRLDTFRKKNN